MQTDKIMKKCSKCGIEKPFSEFCTDKKHSDDLQSQCRQCKNEYYHTKKGLIQRIYGGQRAHSIHRNHPMPSYTLSELREWAFSQKIFHELYDNWKASAFDRWSTPSFDRLDDYKSYTLDNLRIVTWKENNKRSHVDMKSGINNKQSTAIISIKDGKETEFYSQQQAARELGLWQGHINNVLKGILKTTGNYKFKYKE